MRSSITSIVVASALFAVVPFASAQYSSTASAPTALVAGGTDDVQAKISAAPNGGQYVSYFSDAGYDVYVKRLDSNGNVLWTTLVSDRTFSSTTDYGMTSDSAGSCYVVYNDNDPTDPTNASKSAVKMTKLASDGTVAWTTVTYSYAGGGTSLGNGRAAVASDGYVWGAMSVGFDSTLARVNAATGAISFSNYITESGAKQICSGMKASTDGAMLLSTVRYTTNFSNKILRIRKINSDGTYAWGGTAGNAVASQFNIQTGNFPDFISDGAGGAYLPWYTTSPLNCRVQHCDTNGSMTWGTDGVLVATATTGTFGGTSATVNRTNPVVILGSDSRVYAFFKAYSASIAGTVWYGIGGQCFDSAGAAQWNSTDGVMVEDYAAASAGVVYDRTTGAAVQLGSSVGVAYTNSASAISAVGIVGKMNTDGTVASKTTFASDATTKYRFAAAPCSTGSILAWQANAGGASDVYVSRVNSDGTIGNPVVIGDLNGDGIVDGSDLAALLGAWGTCPGSPCPADLNGDGTVDGSDLAALLGHWTV
jgi:hypothetical protein